MDSIRDMETISGKRIMGQAYTSLHKVDGASTKRSVLNILPVRAVTLRKHHFSGLRYKALSIPLQVHR